MGRVQSLFYENIKSRLWTVEAVERTKMGRVHSIFYENDDL